MAVINSLVLYLSLLSVITYGSYKMNYSKYKTKTANEQHTGLEKIPKSLRGMYYIHFYNRIDCQILTKSVGSLECCKFYLEYDSELWLYSQEWLVDRYWASTTKKESIRLSSRNFLSTTVRVWPNFWRPPSTITI